VKQNILLTGSNGFLGKRISSQLIVDFNLFTLSRTNSNINCDLSVFQPILPIVDIVIHSAGMAHILPQSNSDDNAFFKVNVYGTANLLRALEISVVKPKNFIFISSVAVYGLNNGENIKEDCLLLANDSYGKSKIEAEKLVFEWCTKHNVICTILRLPLVVGMNPPGNLGAMINGIKRGYYFNIAGGNAKKSMVLASDIAKFILKAAEVGGTYNLTDGTHPTFNELSKCITRNLGKSFVPNMPLFIANVLAKIGDLFGNAFPINSNKLSKIISTLTFDDSKARRAFGWNPTPVLEGFKIYEC
jgi:nucleoside-diphosphate-sugar epimerase